MSSLINYTACTGVLGCKTIPLGQGKSVIASKGFYILTDQILGSTKTVTVASVTESESVFCIL